MRNVLNLVETRVETAVVYDGALLKVNRDIAKLPDASTSVREWIRHPGASAVVPIYSNGDIVLLRQFRYPVGQVFYEVPAGKLDPGEAADVTAVRELEEEAGLIADEFPYIGHFYPGIGYSDEVIHIFAAIGLTEAPQHTDADEFVEPFRIPFAEAVRWVHEGVINDAKTVICLLRTWEWWTSQPR